MNRCDFCLRQFSGALALRMHNCMGPPLPPTQECLACHHIGPANRAHYCSGTNPLASSKAVTQATFPCTACLVDFTDYQAYKDHMDTHVKKTERPDPMNLGPSTTTEAEAAMVMAVWAATQRSTSDLDAARDYANEVRSLLRRMGFTIELVTGKVSAQVREAEYDFTDFCAECERGQKERVEWDNEEPAYRMGERPDRFCLFHRGYVSGAISEREN